MNTIGQEETPPADTPAESDIERIGREQSLRVIPPARPDLKPGETVTSVPERWCEKCEEARPKRRCAICGGFTVRRLPPDAVPEDLGPPRPTDAELEELEELPEFEDDAGELEGDAGELEEREERAAPRDDGRRRSGIPPRPRVDERALARRVRELEERERELAERERAQARSRTTAGGARGERSGRMSTSRIARGRRQVVDYDDEIQETPSRRDRFNGRRNRRTPEEQLEQQWTDQNVRVDHWVQLYAGILASRPVESREDVEAAAELADAAYIEIMARQQASERRG